MPYKYVVTQNSYLIGKRTIVNYGISLVEEERDNMVVLISIANLSPRVEPVERLVLFCNHLQLDPIHIHDVISDFL